MNSQPEHTQVAFFMLAKGARDTVTPAPPETLAVRLQTLPLPLHQLDFGTVTAQDDVDEFHQCLAHSISQNAAWRTHWIQLEMQYLATKLQYYYAHLAAICKRENVHLKRTERSWEVKFPWQHVATTIALSPGSDPVQRLAELAYAALNNVALASQHVAPQLRRGV